MGYSIVPDGRKKSVNEKVRKSKSQAKRIVDPKSLKDRLHKKV
jgi:hypothetical protein